jgi:hypothetical protein
MLLSSTLEAPCSSKRLKKMVDPVAFPNQVKGERAPGLEVWEVAWRRETGKEGARQ